MDFKVDSPGRFRFSVVADKLRFRCFSCSRETSTHLLGREEMPNLRRLSFPPKVKGNAPVVVRISATTRDTDWPCTIGSPQLILSALFVHDWQIILVCKNRDRAAPDRPRRFQTCTATWGLIMFHYYNLNGN